MTAPRPDGYVLAGGRATRMGRDKALVLLDGTPLHEHLRARLAGHCGRVIVVRGGDQAPLPCPTLVEPEHPDRHPLHGVAAALADARTEHVVIAPCDVPHVADATWRRLLAAAPAVACCDGRVHPLVAVLPRGLAARAAALAASGGSAAALVDGLTRVEVAAEELRDLNTPESVGGFSPGGP